MKNISTGAGLAIVGLGIALHPVLSNVLAASPSANAAPPASLVASAVAAQAAPTVVWMGVTQWSGEYNFYRLWSDGRLEKMSIYNGINYGWIGVPPPPGGNGFACRSDINGDRIVNGADLAFVLDSWGQNGSCEPAATYPCLDLGSLTSAAAMK